MNETPDIQANLAAVRERIARAAQRVGRHPGDITLVAVTKTHGVPMIREALAAGITQVGENRVQEALEKKRELDESHPRLEWHLIGHLQSNKAKQAVQNFALIHSVDSLNLARELDAQAAKLGKQQRILLQLNVSGEESKFGASADEARELTRGVLEQCGNLVLEGFMTMAPFSDDPETARPHFRELRLLSEALRRELGGAGNYAGDHMSMGMTGDFEVAIEEGATLVRIGSAIFGHRE
jgi:pyridoxal phosphate enzyme (YggS family)